MKKLLFGLLAAAGMLFASSCSNELEPGRNDAEARVTFSINVENAVATRAISDGSETDMLVYQVFDQNWKPVGSLTKQTAEITNLETSVDLILAKGQTYQIVFWAQNSKCDAYNTEEFPLIGVSYADVNNDESRDAFFKAETFTVTGDANIRVELKRPFAQLNVGVTKEDWEAAVASGITVVESSVIVKNAGTSIDLRSGEVTGPVEVKYTRAVIPSESLNVDLNSDSEFAADGSETFHWLSMSYILVADGTENGQGSILLDDVNFTFYPEKGNPIVLDEGLNNVPVQRNWRTNILGQLLTGDIKFTIVLDPIYDNDNNNLDGVESTNEIADGVKYDAKNKTFSVYSAKGLQWIANVTNGVEEFPTLTKATANGFEGYTVELTSDIDLKGIKWTPIGAGAEFANAFTGTFNGNGYTISNLTVVKPEKEQAVGLFGNVINTGRVENVIISNADVTGYAWSGIITGQLYGATIQGCTIRDSKVSDEGAWGRAGAFVGLSTDGTIEGCTVTNTDVVAISCVGGLTGVATAEHYATVLKDNALWNVNVIKDITVHNRDNGFAGELIGQEAKPATKENNKIDNVTVSILKGTNGVYEVATAEELFAVATLINEGKDFGSKTIKLTADIDLGGRNWEPINMWKPENQVLSTIDGNKHSIINMTVNGAGSLGFIGSYASTSVLTIKDLTFVNPVVTSSGSFVGTVVGYTYGNITMDNVKVTGATIETTAEKGIRLGGLVGFYPEGAVNPLVLNKCVVEKTTITGYHNLAGLAGSIMGSKATFTDCQSNNNTFYHRAKNTASWQNFDANGYAEGKATKTNCTTEGNVGKFDTVIWNTNPVGATEDNPAGTKMTHQDAIDNAPAGYRLPTAAEARLMIELGIKTKTEEGWTVEFNGQTINLPFNMNDGLADHVYYWVSDVTDYGSVMVGLQITEVSSDELEVGCYPYWGDSGGVIYVKEQ